MMEKRYKHILFDLDGTIFDTYDANMLALEQALHEFDAHTKENKESLGRFFGIPGRMTVKLLGYENERAEALLQRWLELVPNYASSVKIYSGMLEVIKYLHHEGFELGIITSRLRHFKHYGGDLGDCCPSSLAPYFTLNNVVTADDVERAKPYPDSILRYMQLHQAKASEILFIGDAHTDLECAIAAGVDFALALWGYAQNKHLCCKYYLKSPYDLMRVVHQESNLYRSAWFTWASELLAIGQNGLAFTKDIYDQERFERIKGIAQEILHSHYNLDAEQAELLDLAIDKADGYRTPKIDTRAAVFNSEGKILMVQENSGLWTLPGGYCDEHQSICANTIKEVREESGYNVYCERLIALVKADINRDKFPFGIIKSFMLCHLGEGAFSDNSETKACDFFSLDAIPRDKLRISTCTYEQLMMCFDAYAHKDFITVID